MPSVNRPVGITVIVCSALCEAPTSLGDNTSATQNVDVILSLMEVEEKLSVRRTENMNNSSNV